MEYSKCNVIHDGKLTHPHGGVETWGRTIVIFSTDGDI